MIFYTSSQDQNYLKIDSEKQHSCGESNCSTNAGTFYDNASNSHSQSVAIQSDVSVTPTTHLQKQMQSLFSCHASRSAVEANKKRWIDISYSLTRSTQQLQQQEQKNAQMKKDEEVSAHTLERWHKVLRGGTNASWKNDSELEFGCQKLSEDHKLIPQAKSVAKAVSAQEWWIAVWECQSSLISKYLEDIANWDQLWVMPKESRALDDKMVKIMKDSLGLTALHILSRLKQGALCLEIMLCSSSVLKNVDVRDRARKRTALHYACLEGNEEAALLLLKQGASPTLCDRNGDTALHLAVEKGCFNIVLALVEKSRQSGLKINARNKKGQHALILASQRRIAQLLLECGADVNVVDNDKRDAIKHAALKGDAGLLKLFLGANTHARGRETVLSFEQSRKAPEDFILHDVIRAGHDKVFKVLFCHEHYRDLMDCMDQQGYTPLLCAAACGNREICTILLQAGADPHHKASNGDSLFSLLIVNKRDNCLFELSQQLRRVSSVQSADCLKITISEVLNRTPWKALNAEIEMELSVSIVELVDTVSYLLLCGLALDEKILHYLLGPRTKQLLNMLHIPVQLWNVGCRGVEGLSDIFCSLKSPHYCATIHKPNMANIEDFILPSELSQTMLLNMTLQDIMIIKRDAGIGQVELLLEALTMKVFQVSDMVGMIFTNNYLKPINKIAKLLGLHDICFACATRSQSEKMRKNLHSLTGRSQHQSHSSSCYETELLDVHLDTFLLSLINTLSNFLYEPEFRLLTVVCSLRSIVNPHGCKIGLTLHGINCQCTIYDHPFRANATGAGQTFSITNKDTSINFADLSGYAVILFYRMRLLDEALTEGDVLLANEHGFHLRVHSLIVLSCPKLQAIIHFSRTIRPSNEATLLALGRISNEALEIFVFFLYTGILVNRTTNKVWDPDDIDLLIELVSIGQEYLVPDLVEQSVGVVARLLNRDNVSRVYSLAQEKSLDDLLILASIYIILILSSSRDDIGALIGFESRGEDETEKREYILKYMSSLLQPLRS